MDWMPRERWDALVRGEDCPLCAEFATNAATNDHGYAVANLTISRLRLAKNQWVPGYCVLISAIHVREPYELGPNERAAFFDDLMRAGRAIERVSRPIKMNFQILGNAVPHLHCHIVPRYYGDPAPNRPLDPNFGTWLPAADEVAERIAAIRAALVGLSGMHD
jgi:diadenosine tetraphosphate (Ap4A) HIT family hydrolase